MPSVQLQIIRVWDLPTRVFHWALAACFIALVVTGRTGGAAMVWHGRLGYAVATLLLFRLVWGIVGGHWSRFAVLLYSPRSVLAYLRGNAPPLHTVGHNPLGALSVFALLFLLAVQVGTGLFSDDKAEFAGPFNVFISSSMARTVTGYHKNVGEPLLILLVVLHLAAIGFYQLRRRQDLVRPMLHGNKTPGFAAPASRDDRSSRLMAAVALAICAAFVAWLVSLGTD